MGVQDGGDGGVNGGFVPGAGDEGDGWFRHYGVSRRSARLTED